MSRLVGISGQMGFGKSSVAMMLQETQGYEVVSFGDPLKDMVRALLMPIGFSPLVIDFNFKDIDFYFKDKSVIIPHLGVSMRQLLQTLGTEWGRNLIKRSLWVDLAGLSVTEFMAYADVVIDDVRFEDEAAFIREHDGLVIHLRRPSAGAADDHVSESGITVGARDVVIVNDGSLGDLFEAVNGAIERFFYQGDRLVELCLTPCADFVG